MDQKQRKKNKPFLVLVVCPKNIIGSWEDEIATHLSDYTISSLKSLLALEGINGPYTFVITNYEQIRAKIDYYDGWEWDYIILDESHRIKNRKAKTTKAVWRLNAHYKTILSGTPITKDEIDLWSQYKWLNKNIWGNNFKEFEKRALRKINYGEYFKLKPHKQRMKLFMAKAAQFTHRIKLDDITEIPTIKNIPVMLNMQGSAKKAYNELRSGFLTEYQGKRSSHSLNVTGMIRLQQLCGGHLVLEDNDVVRFKEQPKLLWILDKLEDIGKEKLFIVCRYNHEIDLIASALKKFKYKHVIMRGKMKDADIKKARKAFMNDKTCQVLIGQVQVVKEGNNFQKQCRYGVFYSKSLSYVDVEQCKARLRRNGQKRKVLWWHLIMRNTIDESIETIVEKKYLNAEEALLKLIIKGTTMAKETKTKPVKEDKKAAPAKKSVAAKPDKAKPAAKKVVGGERPEFGIEALAKKLGVDARAVRIKLRTAEVERSGKYYDFKNKEGVEKMAAKLTPKEKAKKAA